MTTLTYSRDNIDLVNRWLDATRDEIDLVNRWLDARESEKKNVRTYYGATPMVPANIMLKLAERIWERRHGR